MSISPFDSKIYGGLFSDPVLTEHLSDQALIAAMIRTEAALARTQGALGVIPQNAADAIAAHLEHAQIPQDALLEGTARDGVPVPELVKILRSGLDPDDATYLHWGATSQDILDTAYALVWKAALDHLQSQIAALTAALAAQARAHHDLPMAARTRRQLATPTSFGARVAAWGRPFLRHKARINALRPRLLCASFAGASGNLAALRGSGGAVHAALAETLELSTEAGVWHSNRDSVAELAALVCLVAGSLGKMATDCLDLSQSEIREIRLGAGGGSSTMPHKSNPVSAEAIVTLEAVARAGAALVQNAASHSAERDGAAWAMEWHGLSQTLAATGGALRHATALARGLTPDPEAMARTISSTNGLMFAEAASFALCAHMPRAEALLAVKSACAEVGPERSLQSVLEARFTGLADWDATFDPGANLGDASRIALEFASAAEAIDQI